MMIFRDSMRKSPGKRLGLAPAAFGACALVMVANSSLRAEEASPWSQDLRSAARLIAGSTPNTAAILRAGIEIKMQPGWKTYWRYPGDAGVPPRFDFSGSENLRSATVLWPAPHLFTDEAGNSIGYKDAVVFPVHVTPQDAGKPVVLRLKIDYAVCEKLCIPAEGRAALTLTGGASAHQAAIEAAEARVPKPVSARDAGLSARRVSGAPKPRVSIDVSVADEKNVELFVEGPNAQWALPIPKPAPGAPAGHRNFGFELDGLPPGVDPMAPLELTFTVVGGDRAIETTAHLD